MCRPAGRQVSRCASAAAAAPPPPSPVNPLGFWQVQQQWFLWSLASPPEQPGDSCSPLTWSNQQALVLRCTSRTARRGRGRQARADRLASPDKRVGGVQDKLIGVMKDVRRKGAPASKRPAAGRLRTGGCSRFSPAHDWHLMPPSRPCPPHRDAVPEWRAPWERRTAPLSRAPRGAPTQRGFTTPAAPHARSCRRPARVRRPRSARSKHTTAVACTY